MCVHAVAGSLNHEVNLFLYASEFTFINGSEASPSSESTLIFNIDHSLYHRLSPNLTKFVDAELSGLSKFLADPQDYVATFTGFDVDGTLLQFGARVMSASFDNGTVLQLNISNPINRGCSAERLALEPVAATGRPSGAWAGLEHSSSCDATPTLPTVR